MPFTIDDFPDLLRLLDEHPDWRAELRRRLLTDELLELPAVVRQLAERVDALAEAQARTAEQLAALAERVDALAQRVDGLAQRVDALAQHVDGLAQRVDQLAAQMQELAARMGGLAGHLENLAGHVGWLRGEALEARYHRHFAAYFGRLARRLRLVDASQLGDLLEDAQDAGQLTETEADAVRLADLVLSGRRPADGGDCYLLGEIAFVLEIDDVNRAAQRAQLLERLGRPVVAVVAGSSIDPEAERAARVLGVHVVLNGRLGRLSTASLN